MNVGMAIGKLTPINGLASILLLPPINGLACRHEIDDFLPCVVDVPLI